MNVYGGLPSPYKAALLMLAANLSALCPSPAVAVPVAIYDTGQGHPMADFIAAPALPQAPPALEAEALAADFVNQLFPVSTPELSPGVEPGRAFQQVLPAPFFVVGTDAQSQAWLSQYAARLQAVGAAGLVVEAPSAEAFQQLQALAPGLQLSPVQGSDLATQFGLRHYPVLVTAKGLEQ
ncbi:MAG: integrating conjugative element protein [Candidatus Paceibacterota bacterium]